MLRHAVHRHGIHRAWGLALVAAWWLASAHVAYGQVGALVSPGPLSKAHASLEGIGNCQKCHEPGRGVSASRCLSCHKPVAERMAAKKGVHRAVTGGCEGCHAEHAGVDAELRPFDPKNFDHSRETGFALDGRHAPLAQTCARCHKTRSFLQAQPACVSCHADVHKGTLGSACTTCHTTAVPFAAARAQFDHAKARFQLTGAHRTVDCAKCHANRVYTGLKFASCTDCHREPHRRIFGADCTSCHTTDTWRTRKVDHARTVFPLTGAHASVACASCHVKPAAQVRPASARCIDCHTDVHKGEFKQDCASCHTTATFKQAPFDHEKGGRFPLTGKHASLACVRCHKGAATTALGRTTSTGAATAVVFSGLSSACASCHDDVHKGSAGPTCQTCHTNDGFTTLLPYQHVSPAASFFAGQHGTATCRACHARTIPAAPRAAGVPVAKAAAGLETAAAAQKPSSVAAATWTFKGTPTACTSCHADPHQAEVGTACERCHSIGGAGFVADRFSHAGTSFPLIGRHEATACQQCHVPRAGSPAPAQAAALQPRPGRDASGRSLQFTARGTTCASCHDDVHLGQLGNKCDTCHSPQSFRVPTYVHAKIPKAFFSGQHALAECRACHKPETGRFPAASGKAIRFVGTGTACSSCHQEKDVHNGTLGRECERCHTPERWPVVSRAFHKTGLFPLEGRHLTVACASCHLNGELRGTPVRCFDCHWIRRQDDPKQTRLGTDCESCHRPTSWTAVNWNHGARTGTPLSGPHQSVACSTCHTDLRFMGATVSCSTCHAADYQRTAQPNHAAAGFPMNCEVCHQASQTSWSQAVFTHTTYPLVGMHATQACSACHRANVYRGTPRDCVGCHLADYQKTTNPNHAAAGFPTACQQCHQPSAPSFASAAGGFNHATVYPLVGIHATQACAACHKNGVYKGTARDCVGCHLADYQRTTNPNHAAAGFPTTCEQCHQQSASSFSGGAAFNHASVYPLVGTHASQACAACHKNGIYKGTPRDCVGCHLADYQKTTNPNHAAAGFPTTCDQCHQQSASSFSGAAGGFNHASVFPLVGTHATQPCAACHGNGVYKGTPRDCVGCHLTDYQKTANPNHAAAGFPTTCSQCHQASSATWASSFDHNQFYPLLGRHLQQSCTTCHKNNVYRGTPTACVACHQANYDRTTNPNHAAAGFPTTCESCHRASDSTWDQGVFAHTWFPITSGRHAGIACRTCHTTTNVYTVFSCLTGCHARATTDGHHVQVSGYRYDSAACYACHPTGRSNSPRPVARP